MCYPFKYYNNKMSVYSSYIRYICSYHRGYVYSVNAGCLSLFLIGGANCQQRYIYLYIYAMPCHAWTNFGWFACLLSAHVCVCAYFFLSFISLLLFSLRTKRVIFDDKPFLLLDFSSYTHTQCKVYTHIICIHMHIITHIFTCSFKCTWRAALSDSAKRINDH